MTIYGYARVSTDGQTLVAQEAALTGAGCAKVYAEKVSGVVTDRRALSKAIAVLQEGDTLIVTRLDRLARSTRDLLNTLDAIAKKGRRLQVAGRRLGRHYDTAWSAHADHAGRAGRV
jgi:DNA invertase Pin-like site-specific DNA recombinase